MKRLMLCGLILIFGMVSSTWAASAYTFELGTSFSGESPTGGIPWVTATFENGANGNEVVLTIDNVGLTNPEFMRSFYFNYDGGGGNLTNGDVNFGGQYKADGDGYFDVEILFPTRNDPGTDRFGAGESFTTTLTASGITYLSFIEKSFNSTGSSELDKSLFVAAHIQVTGFDDEGSGWITGEGSLDNGSGGEVPLPASVLLLGSGLLGVSLIPRKKKTR